MPRFDFRCLSCARVFEESIPFGSKKLPPCPDCGKKTEKLLTAPGVQFKGSGFYKTDSGTSAPKPADSPPRKEPPAASGAKE